MIRDAVSADVPAISAIYGHHVLHGVASYDTETPTVEAMRVKLEAVQAAGWPWLVVEHDGAVAGYAYATQIRDRAGYRYTAEDSIYVAAKHVRQGLGRQLLTALVSRCEAAGFRQMIAVIGGAEPGSIALHAAAGFHEVGRLHAVGFKFGRWLDNVYMQRALGKGDPAVMADLPNVDPAYLDRPDLTKLSLTGATHPPRILLLYGSLRTPRSYSKLLALEAERLLTWMGCETRVYDPLGLPQVESCPADHPKVAELRALSLWSEGQVWVSPERHGAMTGILKSQIDWLPLEEGGVRPTQGRTLAVMQVSAGSQSFNAVNAMRILGRWMRMVTIPNQSSVPKAYTEFDDAGRMKPGPLYERVVDVCEELVKFTLLVRDRDADLTDRYSERKAAGREIAGAAHLAAISDAAE